MNERDADAGSEPSYFAARAAKASRRLAAILLNAKFKHFVHDFLRLHHRCLLIIENEKSCSLLPTPLFAGRLSSFALCERSLKFRQQQQQQKDK